MDNMNHRFMSYKTQRVNKLKQLFKLHAKQLKYKIKHYAHQSADKGQKSTLSTIILNQTNILSIKRNH